jgi:fatty acid desaturase
VRFCLARVTAVVSHALPSSERPKATDPLVDAVAVNYRLNYALCGAHLFLNVFALFGFPLLFLPNPGVAVLIVLAISCTSNSLFAVLHEAIHRSLGPVARLPGIGLSTNDLLGRAVGIAFGSPFDFISAAHVTHHSVNRTQVERLEVYEVSLPTGARRSFVNGYYFFLLGGLYTVELMLPMLFLLPARVVQPRLERLFHTDLMVRQVLHRVFRSQRHLRAIRFDAWLIVASIAASTALYGGLWWILALHFLIRAFFISFLDYLYHYGSPLGDRLHGYNLALPRWLSPLILHFNYHGVHHRYPALPWRSLERVFVNERLVFDNHYLTQAVSQLRGPMTREALERLLAKTRATR